MNLYEKHRPKEYTQVAGNEAAMKILSTFDKRGGYPHCLLFTGPSGCGKTTLARIVAHKVGGVGTDIKVLNSALFRGMDSVRNIQEKIDIRPTQGKSRVYILDEIHQQTKDAQNGLLKVLEDTPETVYFLLCTTDPQKLIKAIKTRCTEIKVNLVTEKEAAQVLERVMKREKLKLHSSVISKLINCADGSPRKLLVDLDKIKDIENKEEQLEAIVKSDYETQSIDLCRGLFQKKSWKEIATILKAIEEEPETVRRSILGYANAILLNSGQQRALTCIDIFRDNLYDGGKALLTAMCYEFAVNSK